MIERSAGPRWIVALALAGCAGAPPREPPISNIAAHELVPHDDELSVTMPHEATGPDKRKDPNALPF